MGHSPVQLGASGVPPPPFRIPPLCTEVPPPPPPMSPRHHPPPTAAPMGWGGHILPLPPPTLWCPVLTASCRPSAPLRGSQQRTPPHIQPFCAPPSQRTPTFIPVPPPTATFLRGGGPCLCLPPHNWGGCHYLCPLPHNWWRWGGSLCTPQLARRGIYVPPTPQLGSLSVPPTTGRGEVAMSHPPPQLGPLFVPPTLQWGGPSLCFPPHNWRGGGGPYLRPPTPALGWGDGPYAAPPPQKKTQTTIYGGGRGSLFPLSQ